MISGLKELIGPIHLTTEGTNCFSPYSFQKARIAGLLRSMYGFYAEGSLILACNN
jgi:hypothetical protein